MTWGDLSWLSEHGYSKAHEAGERGPETWMRARQATRKHGDFWRELVIRWTGDEHGKEYVELSAAMLDNDRQMIVVAIDEIDFDELRGRLAFYEQRVLQMLRVGLESAAGGRRGLAIQEVVEPDRPLNVGPLWSRVAPVTS